MAQLDALLKLVDGARDNALLRFAIASELYKLQQYAGAAVHLQQALLWQPDYTAGWKLLGRCLAADGQSADAQAAYRQGIQVAQARGDLQAVREMTVFLRRLTSTG